MDGGGVTSMERVHSNVPIESVINHDELTDIRAYQRTFDGAYTRTALGQLSYAILILRLFERDFYWCGLIYTVLAVQLIFVGMYRYNLAIKNDDRWENVNVKMVSVPNDTIDASEPSTQQPAPDNSAVVSASVAYNTHAAHRSLFRPTFRTAGNAVALATAGTLVLELTLMVLVIRM
ncbi:uncharacterized protein FA14DRAFT_54081 [Meira miltonrushii]|uniref:Uncharacterized protein n=1 Tax=Meira miltonrushii TaxID=1280837 RepID=A0A316VFA9_9BASI|nr:uncharacterized protein FA14DRAFT_54081 [Meira miltonrushii]PWN36317.1 hypothetical protein FA14DRAFT_54081 [Meira miltonrushii]